MRTNFPNVEPGAREYLDEFLRALRVAMENATYFPAPGDLERWRAGARQMHNNFGWYRGGFISWAIPKHLSNFPQARYIPSPWSLRYLWEQFNEHQEKRLRTTCRECGKDQFYCECESFEPILGGRPRPQAPAPAPRRAPGPPEPPPEQGPSDPEGPAPEQSPPRWADW